jgi:hypothetical protein
MDERETTGTQQHETPNVMPSRRFHLVRRFALEAIIIGVAVTAGVAFANWRGVPDRFAHMPSFLAQTSDVVGEAIAEAIAPEKPIGQTVSIPLAPRRDAPTISPNGSESPEAAASDDTPPSPQIVSEDGASRDDESPTSGSPVSPAGVGEPSPSASASVPTGPTYRLTVERTGPGDGILQSSDGKIVCGSQCVADYPPNTSLTLKAYAEVGATFVGWSSLCFGTGACGIVMNGPLTIRGQFDSVPVAEFGTEDDDDDDDVRSGSTGAVRISEVMAGSDGNPENEFIELYNATDAPIVLSGWSVRKKSSTGSESILVASQRFEGKIIPPRKHFLIVHEGLYQGATPADVAWPSSYQLAYSKNSVVLYDGTGSHVETVTWTDIPVGQSYARTSWDEAIFATGAPTPKNSSN